MAEFIFPDCWREDNEPALSFRYELQLLTWLNAQKGITAKVRDCFIEHCLHPYYNAWQSPFLTLQELAMETEPFITDAWRGILVVICSHQLKPLMQALINLSPHPNTEHILIATPDTLLSPEIEHYLQRDVAKLILDIDRIPEDSDLAYQLNQLPPQQMLIVGENKPEGFHGCSYLEAPYGFRRKESIFSPLLPLVYSFLGGEPEALFAGAFRGAIHLIEYDEVSLGLLPLCSYLYAHSQLLLYKEPVIKTQEPNHELLAEWANSFWHDTLHTESSPSEQLGAGLSKPFILLETDPNIPDYYEVQDNALLTIRIQRLDGITLGFLLFALELAPLITRTTLQEFDDLEQYRKAYDDDSGYGSEETWEDEGEEYD